MNNLFNYTNKNDSYNKDNSIPKDKNINNNSKNTGNITLIDFQQNVDKRISITSPRSLLALKICGYKQEDLYKLTFSKFIESHPEINNMSKELKEQGYFYFEKNREEKIEKAINIRQQIIDEKLREENKYLNHKENNINSLSIYDNNKNLNKWNSYLSTNNIFNKNLKQYFKINNIKKRNKNIDNNIHYYSFINKSIIKEEASQEKPVPISGRNQKFIDFYKLKNENELLSVLSNEVNRKIIKNKLLNKEFIQLEYEKQKQKKYEERKIEEKKKKKKKI